MSWDNFVHILWQWGDGIVCCLLLVFIGTFTGRWQRRANGFKLKAGDPAAIIARELSEQTKSQIHAGDITYTVKALDQVVDLLDIQLRNLTPGGKDSAARSLNKAMVEIVNNLLQPLAQSAWQELTVAEQLRAATMLLDTVEEGAFVLADNLLKTDIVQENTENILSGRISEKVTQPSINPVPPAVRSYPRITASGDFVSVYLHQQNPTSIRPVESRIWRFLPRSLHQTYMQVYVNMFKKKGGPKEPKTKATSKLRSASPSSSLSETDLDQMGESPDSLGPRSATSSSAESKMGSECTSVSEVGLDSSPIGDHLKLEKALQSAASTTPREPGTVGTPATIELAASPTVHESRIDLSELKVMIAELMQEIKKDIKKSEKANEELR
ncbi:AGRL3 protein, partial [Polypterus senegalus]